MSLICANKENCVKNQDKENTFDLHFSCSICNRTVSASKIESR